jgi:hypothetical protein
VSIKNIKNLFSNETRQKTEKYWLVICIVYAALRTILVNYIFGKHGVNPWGYFACDLVSSIFFAKFSFGLITAWVDNDKSKFRLYLILTATSFFAPDLYIFINGQSVPHTTYILFFIYLIGATVITLLSLMSDYRKKRTNQ